MFEKQVDKKMVKIETIIKNNDNSGIKTGKIFHIYNTHKKDEVKIANLVLISTQKIDFHKQQKKKITYAIIVKLKKKKNRFNGHYISFKESGIITLPEKDTFKAKHIKGPIASELRYHKIQEIMLAAKVLI